jgi:hypothetical protein
MSETYKIAVRRRDQGAVSQMYAALVVSIAMMASFCFDCKYVSDVR